MRPGFVGAAEMTKEPFLLSKLSLVAKHMEFAVRLPGFESQLLF